MTDNPSFVAKYAVLRYAKIPLKNENPPKRVKRPCGDFCHAVASRHQTCGNWLCRGSFKSYFCFARGSYGIQVQNPEIRKNPEAYQFYLISLTLDIMVVTPAPITAGMMDRCCGAPQIHIQIRRQKSRKQASMNFCFRQPPLLISI